MYIYMYIRCFRLGNPDLDLKIRIFGFPIELKIRKGILPHLTWISINKIRGEIPLRILRSIENPKIRSLGSKPGFPNRKHPKESSSVKKCQ